MKIKILEDRWTPEMDSEYTRLYYQKMTTSEPLTIDEQHKLILLTNIKNKIWNFKP